MIPESSLDPRPASVERVRTGLGTQNKEKRAGETTQKERLLGRKEDLRAAGVGGGLFLLCHLQVTCL